MRRVVPTRAAGAATVDDLLRTHKHGNVLVVEHAPETTTVPAATPAPLTVVPTAKAPDVTAESVSVVAEIPPVAAAEAKVGAAPSPAGQKKPGGHAVCVVPPAKVVQ